MFFLVFISSSNSDFSFKIIFLRSRITPFLIDSRMISAFNEDGFHPFFGFFPSFAFIFESGPPANQQLPATVPM